MSNDRDVLAALEAMEARLVTRIDAVESRMTLYLRAISGALLSEQELDDAGLPGHRVITNVRQRAR